MKETFKREWLKEIPTLPLVVPAGYDLGNFVNWEKKFQIMDDNLISSYDSNFGNVYDVGDGLVAKTLRNSVFIKKRRIFNDKDEASMVPYFLERAFWMTKELGEKGFYVPKEKGLFLIHHKALDHYLPAFVMGAMPFPDYKNMAVKKLQEIDLLREEEINRAKKEDFVVGWDAKEFRNNPYSEKDKRVGFIDFMFWGIK